MKLLVGLGNHGAKYAKNRHNIGYMVVDEIHRRHNFSPWRKRFRGQTADGLLADEKVLLLKPETYMNESGRSVSEAARFLKIKAADTIVFHDELDLAPGKLKAKVGGGHAGHNGLRSIIAQFDKEFVRVRLGIGHPGHKDRVAGYVLHDFAKADTDWLDRLVETIAREAELLVTSDLSRFQTAIGQALAGQTRDTPAQKPSSTGSRTGAGTGAQRSSRPAAKPGARKAPSQTDLARRAAAGPDKRKPAPTTKSQSGRSAEQTRQADTPQNDPPEKNVLAEKLKAWFRGDRT